MAVTKRNTYEIISLLRHVQKGLASKDERILDCAESVLSFVVLHLREPVAEVSKDLQPYVDDLLLFTNKR